MRDFSRVKPDAYQDLYHRGRRLRLQLRGEPMTIDLYDETTLPECVAKPDANHVTEHHAVALDVASARWLHEALGELLAHLDGKPARPVDGALSASEVVLAVRGLKIP